MQSKVINASNHGPSKSDVYVNNNHTTNSSVPRAGATQHGKFFELQHKSILV